MGKVLDKYVEKIKTYFVFSHPPLLPPHPENCNVEKYFRAGQTSDDNMAHAH
jgi:hypothetical protein